MTDQQIIETPDEWIPEEDCALCGGAGSLTKR